MKIIKQDFDSETTIVQIEGNMDFDGANDLDPKLAAIAAASQNLIVDISNVPFMASTGLRVLISAAKQIDAKQGTLVLLNPDPMVVQVLETTGATSLLPIVFDMGAARKAISPSTS